MSSISYNSHFTLISSLRQVKIYFRYIIWLALAGTANANRRHFGLATTWAPHLVGNSIALLLPEIYRIFERLFGLKRRLRPHQTPTGTALRRSLEDLVEDNPDYLDYVAPAALAYIVSHPDFNIYRGRWGRLSFMGFGLDSIPHGATAYALSNLAYDTMDRLECNTPPNTPIRSPVRWLAARKTLVTGVFIAFLTFIYELGEYRIHKAELKARDYDITQINMMWTPKDMLFDVLSNIIGWIFSAWRHRNRF